jgi:hypothetical protein
MTTRPPIITLISDFGETDAYVGVMKGVILSIIPTAQIIDITHQIEPQNIRQAASIIGTIYPYYPPHTVHVIIVDPGVGTLRHPIAIHTRRGLFVAPDNGILTTIINHEPDLKIIELTQTKFWLPSPSTTFHGRDIFSPVAAHLASGVPISELGTPLQSPATLFTSELKLSDQAIEGEIVRIDHFGNLITNISPLYWVDDDALALRAGDVSGQANIGHIVARTARVTCGWHSLSGIHKTYLTVKSGEPVALIGSNAELEIAINQGNASESLRARVGDTVTVHLL